MIRINLLQFLFTIFPLISCGIFAGNPEEDDGEKKNSGQLIVQLTDAPIDDLINVNIQIDKLILMGNGSPLELDVGLGTIDLLSLQGGKAADLLSTTRLREGRYSQIKLVLSDKISPSGILKSGEKVDVSIPSAEQSGIKINYSFEVISEEKTEIVLDFDLRKSIRKNQNRYVMRPVIRPVNRQMTGQIRGIFQDSHLICAFEAGESADEGDDCPNAVTSAIEIDGAFTLSFLPEGKFHLRVFRKNGTYFDRPNIDVTRNQTTVISDN